MVLFTRKVDFLGWQLAIDKKHTAAMLGKRLSIGIFSFTLLLGWQWIAGRLASWQVPPIRGGIAANLPNLWNCQVQTKAAVGNS